MMLRSLIIISFILLLWNVQKSKYKKSNKIKIENAEILLGKKLFFDPILSLDNSISCASCHQPNHGFADTTALSLGIHNTLTQRNTPSVKNVLNRSLFFWDGRTSTIEDQALQPIENKNEMALPIVFAIKKLNENREYKKLFKEVYQSIPTKETLAKAITSYEKTLESDFTDWDLYSQGDSLALSASATRGLELFINKANCFDCHFGPDFTADELLNIGLYDGKFWNDKGLANITKSTKDNGKFKVPSLRNIAKTAPYMHNGRIKSLEDVIEFYNDPSKLVPQALNVDKRIKQKLNLSEQEKFDLLSFLNALTDHELE